MSPDDASRRADRAESFLSPAEAADLLGVHPRTLSRWEQAGKLHVIRTVGGHRRYRRTEVLALRSAVEGEPPASPSRGAEPAPPVALRPAAAPDERARARRRALELLHAGDVTDTDSRDGMLPEEPPAVRALVEGVCSHRGELDEMIEARSEHWTLDRMPVVDRNLLRLGLFELLHTGTPPGVVIDQAVTLAKMLSTEASGRFVNGILGAVARERAKR